MRRFQDHRFQRTGKAVRHEPLLKFAKRVLGTLDADVKALENYAANWKPVSRKTMVKAQVEDMNAAQKEALEANKKVEEHSKKQLHLNPAEQATFDTEKGRLFVRLMDICGAVQFVCLTLRRDEVLAKGTVEDISRRGFRKFIKDEDDRTQFLVQKYFFYAPDEITKFHISRPKVQHVWLPKGTAKERDLAKKWYIVDATNLILGRLATRVATILMGKHKPTYTPYIDMGDYVVVINAEKIRLTGNKEQEKIYQRYSGYQGGRKEIPYADFRKKHADDIIRLAVRRMIPKKRLGRAMLTKLKVYVGKDHPHGAQKPEALDLTKIRGGRLQFVEV